MKHKVTLLLTQGKSIDRVRASYDDETHMATTRTGHLFWSDEHHYEISPDDVSYDGRGRMVIGIDVNLRKSISLNPKTEPDANREALADYLSDKSFWARVLSSLERKRDWWEVVFILFAGIGVYSVFRVVVAIFGWSVP